MEEAVVLDLEIDATAAAAGAERFDNAVDGVADSAGRAAAAADKAGDAMEGMGRAAANDAVILDKLRAAADPVINSTVRMVDVNGRAERALERVRAQADPLYGAQQRLARQTDILDQAFRAGLLTEAEKARTLAQLQARYDSLADRLRGATTAQTSFAAANDNAARSSGRMGGIMQQVGFQVGDAATQIAMGGSAVQALAVQGSQLLGVFGPWGAVIGAAVVVASALGSAMFGLGKNTEDAAKAADAHKRAMEKAEAFTRTAAEQAKYLAEQRKQEALDTFKAALAQEELTLSRARAAAERASGVLERLQAVQDSGRDVSGGLARATETLTGLGKITADTTARIADLSSKMTAANAVSTDTATRTTRTAKGTRDQAQATDLLVDGVSRYIADLQTQTSLLGMEADERAKVEAVMRAQQLAMQQGNLLTEEQIRIIREQIGAQQDLRRADEDRRKAEDDARRSADQAAREADRARENAAREAERATDRVVDYAGTVFADFFSDTPKSWKEMWEDMRSTALQTLAKLAADLILRPVIQPIVNAAYGVQGGGGTAGSLSGMVGGGSSGGIGSIADVGKLISSFTKGSVTVGKAFAHAAEFIGGGAETQALAGNAGMNLSSPAGIAGGFAGNFLADAIFGSNRGMGSSIGGTIGAVAGSFIPIPFVGTALGAFVGNFIGGLFGGKVKQPQAILTTTALTAPESNFAVGVYQDTPFGRVGLGDAGTRKFPGEVAFVDFIATIDKGVARYLTDAQTAAAGALLQTGAGAVRHKFDTFNLGEEGFLHASERIKAVSQSVFGDGVYEKLARGLGPIDEDDTGKNIEELVARFQQASGFLNNFDTILGELTSGVADFGAAARQQGVDQLRALTEALGGFDEMVDTLGLSSSEVDAAKRSWVEVQLGLKEATEPASALEQSIEQVKGFFSAAGELAKQVGLSEQQVQQGLNSSLQKLAEGWDQGIADQILGLTNPLELALRQQKDREESLLRDIETLGGSAEERQRRILEVEKLIAIERQKIVEQFATDTTADLRGLLGSLSGFASSLRTGSLSALSPDARFGAAESEFRRVAALAASGNAAALESFQGTATTYLESARSRYGSTAAYAGVFDQVTRSLQSIADRPIGEWTTAGNQITSAIGAGTRETVDAVKALRDEVKALRAEMRAQGNLPRRVA